MIDSLSRVAGMSLSDLKSLFFLLSAIAELEDTSSFGATNGLLMSIERMIGVLSNQQDLFSLSNSVILRLAANKSL